MSNNHLFLLDNAIQAHKQEYFPEIKDSDFFEYFVAKEILKNEDLSIDEIEAGIIGGARDGGIDAAFLFINDRLIFEHENITAQKNSIFKLHIIQCSRTEGFKEDAIIKLENSLNDLFDLSKNLNDLTEIFNQDVLDKFSLFHSTYKAHSSKYPRLEIHLHYATRATEEIHPTVRVRAQKLKQNLQNKFGTMCEVSFNFLGATKLWELACKEAIKSFSVIVNSSTISTTTRDTVCFVALSEYKKFITNESGDLRKNIFEANVRDYQGDVKVNQSIESTLKNKSSEEDFWWLNNGITIVCSNFRLTGNELTIEDPQIVNGLQTSNQIFNFFKENASSENSEKRNILIRIIRPDNDNSRDRIIQATNSQTAISPAQLRATELIHSDIEKFFETNGIYYDRKKNYYRNAGRPRHLIISILRLAQAINAIFLQKPHISRGNPSSLIKSETYTEIFNKNHSLGLFLNAAKIMMTIERFMKTDDAKNFSQDLKYHLAMFAVAKKIKKVKPNHDDLTNNLELNLDNAFLLECLTDINNAIIALREDDLTSINKIAKTSDSVEAILTLLEKNFMIKSSEKMAEAM